ncbi:MAG TPA: GHKL domain-containing protein [Candidatus Limiplasma sp.]|nr:GHKL domain-containing protein [Candidatus Limiplasma sp.]
MQLYDIFRSIVTNAMLATLLFSLAQPRCRMRTLVAALVAIVTLDLALNIVFYLRNDYTTLGKLDILFFILVGAAVKPLFRETLMQWLFNCLTAMNVYAVVVVLSYYLCGLLPYPEYFITVLRFFLFAGVIILFRRRLRPLYRQAAEHWTVYLFVAASLFLNFAWYFIASSDVERTLQESVVPLLLLILQALFVYLAMFLTLRMNLRDAALREENLKMQADRELTRQRLSLMDETVRQMSIVQHDCRHFNNTLLSLLQQGDVEKATELVQQRSAAFPQKPGCYCQNASVNAAVSYYAELARQRGINCELRLDIPEKLSVDELSLAMAVSNLLENAIQAVSDLPAEKRTVRMIAVNAGQLILELTNPYQGEVLLGAEGIPCSRRKGHGRGTQSVAAFVHQCGGELTYQITDGIFKVRMML